MEFIRQDTYGTNLPLCSASKVTIRVAGKGVSVNVTCLSGAKQCRVRQPAIKPPVSLADVWEFLSGIFFVDARLDLKKKIRICIQINFTKT